MNAAYALRHDDVHMVEITLAKGDKVVGTTKDMMYMEPGISQDQEENRYVEYINDDFVQRKIAFGSPFISKIVPIELGDSLTGVICMNQAFLCAAHGSAIDIGKSKRSELFCTKCYPYEYQKIQGDGTVFLSSTGTVIRRELTSDEVIRIDMTCLLAMSQEVQYDFQIIGKSQDECTCIATVAGPGTLWLQTTSFHHS